MDAEGLKEKAALAALDEVRGGMRLGLGTGSTAFWFLKHLGAALADGRLQDVAGVPTSEETTRHCRAFGIPIVALADQRQLDLAVDGADEIDPRLDLIKGLGAALLREKMVAIAARRFLVIADDRKNVPRLGLKAPLPVEVVPFEWRWQLSFLEELGARPELRVDAAGAPRATDNGNLILDCHFDGGIHAPGEVAHALESRPGVVQHGLFIGLCDRAIVATDGGIVSSER